MADKKESALGAVTDFAQARVLDASGASKNISKADMASVLAGELDNISWRSLSDVSPNMSIIVSTFEESFKNGSTYTLLSLQTNLASEAGLIIFKRTNTATSIGLLFSIEIGLSYVKRDGNGVWLYKSLMSK